jgi:hypothetical protein
MFKPEERGNALFEIIGTLTLKSRAQHRTLTRMHWDNAGQLVSAPSGLVRSVRSTVCGSSLPKPSGTIKVEVVLV